MKLRFGVAALVLFFCLPVSAFCQLTSANGFIISASGDTLRGRLEYVNSNLSPKRAFIQDGAKTVTFLTPEITQAFYINPEISFRTLPLKGKKVFMQVVSEGPLNLYRFKGELFVKSITDSLVMLTGGKRTVEQNGKKYAIYDYSYKSQLRKNISTNAFDTQIDQLPFEDKKLVLFAQEINHQPSIKLQKKLFNQHQFGGQVGLARAAFNIRKTNYQGSDFHSKQAMFESDVYFEKEKVAVLSAGVYYRRKAGRKPAYLKAAFLFEKAISRTETQTKNLYRSFLIGSNTEEPYGKVGYMTDRYHYDFAAISLPVSYFGELSAGRLRPYADLGINTRIYINRSLTLHREIYIDNSFVSEEDSNLKTKPLTIGPKLDFGFRYLLSNTNSVAAGLHFDAVFSKNIVNPNDFKTNTTMLYIAFGF